MDFETPTKPRLVEASEVASGEETTGFFFTREPVRRGYDRNQGGTQVGSPGRIPNLPANRRLLILATGACCFGLLAYGVDLWVKSDHSTGPTYRFTLPPAPNPAQSAASVKALPPPNLLKPLSPQQASQENAERPFAARPDTAASRFFLKTDAEDRTRALTCLAQAAYYEAAGEGVDGQRAVAQVVLNRVRHPGFPTTICGVVYEGADRGSGCQFSFTCDGSMQRVPVPWLWRQSKQIAEEALKGRVFAPVGHATHYHADYVLPYWADSLDKSAQIGRHIFYRLRNSLGDARAFSQHYGGTEPPFREPGPTLVMPQTQETQQLANTLISDGAHGSAPKVEKASTPATSPLLVDSRLGTLLADAGNRQIKPERPRSSAQCAGSNDRKQVSALKADDLRASLDATGC